MYSEVTVLQLRNAVTKLDALYGLTRLSCLAALLIGGCGSSQSEPSVEARDAGSDATTAGSSGAAGDTTYGAAGEHSAGSAGGPPVMQATTFDAGSDPARNQVAPADLCTRLATINCAGEAFCCQTPTRTVDACKADLIKTCSSDLMLDRIAANPITGFDAAAAERAYTELERKASVCDETVAAWGGSADGLRGILKGTIAANASCKPPQTIPDKASIAAALVSCTEPTLHACAFTSLLAGDWSCAAKVGAGGACNTDNNCNDGLYCVLPALAAVGSCTERKAVGASCSAPTQCASLYCKSGKCVAADRQAAYCLVN
jgi:hypothetical protein